MPKLKKSDMEKRGELLKARISFYMDIYGIEEDEMAASLRMCLRTFQKRMKQPERWQLQELNILSEKLHTTMEQLISLEMAPPA